MMRVVAEPRALLVRGVNWLGDAVMTMPAMQRLRERFPQSSITLLTDEKLADLWRTYSSVDHLMVFQRGESPWKIGHRLRSSRFDTAIIWPNSARSALEPWFAGIPNRVGYATGFRRWLLNTPVAFPGQFVRLHKRSVSEIKRLVRSAAPRPQVHSAAPATHQIHHYLQLAAALGADTSPVAPQVRIARSEVDQTLKSMAAREDPAVPLREENPLVLGLNISAAYGPAKRWPVERFASVVRAISASVDHCVWLSFGSGSDWELSEELKGLSQARVINLAGKTSLRELMCLLKACRAVLTNDSGPMHLAAALGTPVIVPFGSTSPELTGPGPPGDSAHRILQTNAPCSPCFRRTCPIDFRCMTGITVEQVVGAVRAVLQGKSEFKWPDLA